MFSFASLETQLADIEKDLLSGHSSDGSRLGNHLKSLEENARLAVVGGEHDHQKVDSVRRTANRVHMITATLLSLDKNFETLCSKTLQEATLILQESKIQVDVDKSQELSETQHYFHLRKFFLDNLHHPYPRDADKQNLVKITNESATRAPVGHGSTVTIERLTSWFINARRRSGWTDIMKCYARNEKTRMQELVKIKMSTSDHSTSSAHSALALDKILSENLERPLTAADKKHFEDEWSSMISYIKYGVKDKVGDWLQHIVPASKKTQKLSQGRPVTTAAKRSPARKAPKAKGRKPKPRASKTPSLDSNSDDSFLESSSELSMCSTADTSLSSSTNNFSMLHCDPFQHRDGLLQSPTLSAKGSRKVKGLPKRAQQPCLPESLPVGKSTLFPYASRQPSAD